MSEDTPKPKILLRKKDIVGQRRTGDTKKFTVYKKEFPGYVFKGDYSEDEKRYLGLYDRSEILKVWGEIPELKDAIDIIALPLIFYAGKIRITPESGKTRFVVAVFENLLHKFPGSYEMFTERSKKYTYRVSTDKTLVKLNKLPAKEMEKVLKKHARNIILAMVLLFILKTGDVQLWNIIYNTKTRELKVIDFEETRGTDFIDDPIFFFNKKPAKGSIIYNIFPKYYEMIADILSEVDLIVPKEFENMDDSVVSKKMVRDRKKLAIKLLRKYGGGNGSGSDSDDSESSDDSSVSDVSSDSDDDTDDSESSESIKQEGKLKWVSMRGGSVTYHGLKLSVIKSVVQKNIRRGKLDQSLNSAFEMYGFKKVGGMPGVHNLYNRLNVISAEDISPNEYGVLLAAYVSGWNVKWVHKDNLDFLPKKSRKMISTEDHYAPERLAAIVEALAEAKKSRLPSHIWNGYVREEGRKDLYKYLKKHPDSELTLENVTRGVKEMTDDDHKLYESRKNKFLLKSDYSIQKGKFAKVLIMIYNRLKNRDFNAMAWVNYFLEEFDGVKVESRNSRTKFEIALWGVLGMFVPDEVLVPLRDAFFTLSETRPPLQFLVTFILTRPPGNITFDLSIADISSDIDKLAKKYKSSKRLSQLLSFDYDLVIKDYMLDKHTGKRGNEDDLIREFRQKGAKVKNQDTEVYNEVLEKLYEK